MFTLREAVVQYRPGKKISSDSRILSSRHIHDIITQDEFGLGILLDSVTERFIVIGLDAKNKITGWNQISQGTINECPVSPGDAFRFLILTCSRSYVFVHNHPSGDPSPSGEDVALTKKLVSAGDILGIKILDHIIVSHQDYFSFLDAGLLNKIGE